MKKRLFLFTILILLMSSTSALAVDAKPFLKSATLDITVSESGNQIKETVTLSNIEGFENRTIEHIFTNLGDISDLSFSSNGENLDFEIKEDKTVNRLLIQFPEEISNEFTYEIAFNHLGEKLKIPMIIPSVSSDGNGNDVLLKVTIPNGKYLHDSFPIIDSGKTGSIEEYMMNIPNFLNLEISESPSDFFTKSNMYTALGLFIILGTIALWVLNEIKSKQKVGRDINV
jgi:hypothetical protein